MKKETMNEELLKRLKRVAELLKVIEPEIGMTDFKLKKWQEISRLISGSINLVEKDKTQ